MTISEGIELLIKIREKHGNVKIFFDCPQCSIAYSPSIVVTIATHFTEDKIK